MDTETRVRFYEMMHLGMPWWEFILRAVAVYTVVLLLTRITGKRAVGQSTPFDVLVIVLLGTAVQNSLIGEDVSLLGGLILAATLLLLNWLVGVATARSRRLDTWVQAPRRAGAQRRSFLEGTGAPQRQLRRFRSGQAQGRLPRRCQHRTGDPGNLGRDQYLEDALVAWGDAGQRRVVDVLVCIACVVLILVAGKPFR